MTDARRYAIDASGRPWPSANGDWMLARDYDALAARLAEAQKALRAIADLDPEYDSDEGFNEWGEADCFRKAQEIARAAGNESGERNG